MKSGKIYQIYCNKTNKRYIGSTCQDRLTSRLQQHKYHYKKYMEAKEKGESYRRPCMSFNIIQNGDYAISLVEEVEFNDKQELLARERYYIENYDNVENYNIPTRTAKERYDINREQVLQKCHDYYHNKGGKEVSKLYYNNNRTKILEYQNNRNKENRKININKDVPLHLIEDYKPIIKYDISLNNDYITNLE